MNKISVGIPTYCRPESLLKRIDEFENFRHVLFELVIRDNSPESDPRLLARVQNVDWIDYRLNSSNIGGGANFLRVVEEANGDFLWWRGDDDPITTAQVNALLASLPDKESLVILSPSETRFFESQGVSNFASHFGKVRSMGWFSMVVLPLKTAKKALPYGYWGIHTGWANICLILGLFRSNPELPFCVIPFNMGHTDFREDGRTTMWWAFFQTCIKQFPLTSDVISNVTIRKEYLHHWRKTQKFKLLKTMARLRVGLSKQESISITTLLPLVHWRSPRTSLLALLLYCISKIPRACLRIILAIYSKKLSPHELERLELQFLNAEDSISARYRLICDNATNEKVGSFL